MELAGTSRSPGKASLAARDEGRWARYQEEAQPPPAHFLSVWMLGCCSPPSQHSQGTLLGREDTGGKTPDLGALCTVLTLPASLHSCLYLICPRICPLIPGQKSSLPLLHSGALKLYTKYTSAYSWGFESNIRKEIGD